MDIDKSLKKWLVFSGLGLILFNFIINNLGAIFGAYSYTLKIFMPFIIGGAIAFIINTPMKFIEVSLEKLTAKKTSWLRPISILLAIILIAMILFFVFKTVIPELTNAVMGIANNLPQMVTNFTNWVMEIFDTSWDNEWINELKIRLDNLSTDTITWLQDRMTGFIQDGISFIFSTVNSVFNLIIAFAFALFILGGKEKLIHHSKKMIKAFFRDDIAESILIFSSRANMAFTNFLVGQCTEAIIYGTLAFGLMTIFRFPYATTISILVTFTALIPYFGGFIGTAIGSILIFTISPMRSLTFIIMITVLQQFEGNLIYPRVVGRSVGLPGIWVMASVALGGSIAGLKGMIIAVPLASLIYVSMRDVINYKLYKKEEIKNEHEFISFHLFMKNAYEHDLAVLNENKNKSIFNKTKK
ncbi:MAG: AI-2E family transporter [Tissierellia bacterium]|nr:AI-2E family transporter [Tissierellia bacterium]